MTPQIQDVQSEAFNIYRTLANHRRISKFAIKDIEFAVCHFISLSPRDKSAVICFLYQLNGGDVYGECAILFNALEGMALVLESNRERGWTAAYNPTPGVCREVRFSVNFGPDKNSGKWVKKCACSNCYLRHLQEPPLSRILILTPASLLPERTMHTSVVVSRSIVTCMILLQKR